MAQRVEVAPQHSRTRTQQAASVVLTVPAHKDYVVIIRSAVAQLGACFGYTIREITDLRLAVNEACGLLVAGSPATRALAEGSIQCRAEVHGDVLRVTVAAPAGALTAPDPDGLGWNIMTALVDVLAWAQDGVTARVNLEKRRGNTAYGNGGPSAYGDPTIHGSPGG